jgi:hypothetical protein
MRCISLLAALFTAALAHAQPLTTAFTFQGQLMNNAAPVSGVYDLQFRLFDAVTGGTQVGPTLCADNLTVTAGQVATQLDFGSQFAGQQRFLEVAVRLDTGLNCSNASGFTTLWPRQQLTATPNAVYSLNAASAANAATAQSANTANSANTATTATNATQLNGQSAGFYTNAANLTGTLPGADLSGTYSAQLNLSNASNVFQGSFSGSGAGLTSVPWAGINGIPPLVALLPTPQASVQTGNLDVSGNGAFGSVNIGGAAAIGNAMYVLGVAEFNYDDSDGVALRYGFAYSKGISSEAGGSVMNLDLNFRGVDHTTSNRGAAVRLDERAGDSPIQFLVRAAGSSVETTAMAIEDDGHVGFGTTPPSSITQMSVRSSTLETATFWNDNPNTTVVDIAALAPSGGTTALLSEVASPSGTAVWAQASAATGPGIALHAVGFSPSGNAGVFEGPGADVVTVNNTGNGRGMHVTTAHDTAVWAESTTGLAGVDARCGGPYGVYALATATTGTVFGVYGQSNSAAGYGLYSNGRTGASGTKSFRIDHPDDPTNKYLLHYCTESPEVLNSYRGTVTLNDQGEATIDLPPYFSKINKDPSYQLTPVGAPMPLLHIATKISQVALEEGAKAAPEQRAPACSFTIAGGAPNGEVCWRIEAVRNDRWVQAHGAPVEVEKDARERGTYQHPDLYNQPADKAAGN